MSWSIDSVSLPKWPMMATIGEKVTPDQAAEVIVRCMGSVPFSNDRIWERQIREALGLPAKGSSSDTLEAMSARLDELGLLDLDYLSLGDRIASAYIGGPHGWMHWNGSVGESGHSIGKWPEPGEVLDEWSRIAEAFPFLYLTSQLFDREAGEDNPTPVIEYKIDGGVAIAMAPETKLTVYPWEFNPMGLLMPGRERGCSIDVLHRGVELALTRGKS